MLNSIILMSLIRSMQPRRGLQNTSLTTVGPKNIGLMQALQGMSEEVRRIQQSGNRMQVFLRYIKGARQQSPTPET